MLFTANENRRYAVYPRLVNANSKFFLLNAIFLKSLHENLSDVQLEPFTSNQIWISDYDLDANSAFKPDLNEIFPNLSYLFSERLFSLIE